MNISYKTFWNSISILMRYDYHHYIVTLLVKFRTNLKTYNIENIYHKYLYSAEESSKYTNRANYSLPKSCTGLYNSPYTYMYYRISFKFQEVTYNVRSYELSVVSAWIFSWTAVYLHLSFFIKMVPTYSFQTVQIEIILIKQLPIFVLNEYYFHDCAQFTH